MKSILSLCALVTFCLSSDSAFAKKITHQRLDIAPIVHYLASPKFADSLNEAARYTNGWKLSVDYFIDNSNRTTHETVLITVRGKDEGSVVHYRKASFTLTGINGGQSIESSPVTKTEITQDEFSNCDAKRSLLENISPESLGRTQQNGMRYYFP